MGSFSANHLPAPHLCDVLSCLEKAVWTFSQLQSEEAHYVFKSCCRKRTSTPPCPGSSRNASLGSRLCSRGAGLRVGQTTARKACGTRPLLAGGDAAHLARSLGERRTQTDARSSQESCRPSRASASRGCLPESPCGSSAWIISLPLVPILSPVIFFISAQCHFLWEAVLIGSNTTVWGSYGTSCLFYKHLQWLPVPGPATHCPLNKSHHLPGPQSPKEGK